MSGVEKVEFFKERPQWLEKTTELNSEKMVLKDLDVDKFMAKIGFYQR